MKNVWWIFILIFLLTFPGRAEMQEQVKKIKIYNAETSQYEELDPVKKTDEEWKKTLTPLQFDVTRKHGTERPFTDKNLSNHKHGVYKCIGCGIDLFLSDAKFDSGTGWPSF